MPDIFDQITTTGPQGDIFDQIAATSATSINPFTSLKAESYAAENMREDVKAELAGARKIQRLLEQTLPPEQARVSANVLASNRFNELVQQVKQPVGVKPSPELRLKEDYRTIFTRDIPAADKEEAVKERTKQFLLERMDEIQQTIQEPYDQKEWEEYQEKYKGKFLKKSYQRWERGAAMLVGGGLHLAEQIQRLVSGGKYGDSAAEMARLYHKALNMPTMQPVIENVFDKYLGGAVESAPYLLAAMPVAAATGGASIPAGIASFLVSYAVEGNSAYQTALDRNEPEKVARLRGLLTGIINGGIEVAGGGAGKYFKNRAITAAMTKLGRTKYFTRQLLHNALREGLREELPQEIVSMVVGGDVPRLKNGSIDWNTATDRLIDTAIMGTVIGGLMDAPISAMTAAKIKRLAKEDTTAKTFKGKAYRAETGFKAPGTAADVVRHEQETLGNDLGVTEEQLRELEKRPASDIVWVTKDKKLAARYAKEDVDAEITPADLAGVSEVDVEGGKIIANDGEGGQLVLKPTATKEESAAPSIPSEVKIREIRKLIDAAVEHGDLEKLSNLENKIYNLKLNLNTKKAAGAVTIRLDEPGGEYAIISPSAKQKDKWQVTKFNKRGHPTEDTTRDSLKEVIELISGKESGTFDFSDDKDFVVTETTKFPTTVQEELAAPSKPSRKKQLTLGHKIPKLLGLSDTKRREIMKSITGKSSMKDMTPAERQDVVDEFTRRAADEGIDISSATGKKKGPTPITLAGEGTTMEKVVEDSVRVVDELPAKVEMPKHVKKQFMSKIRRSGIGRRMGRLFWGIDSSPLYELSNVIEQGKPGVLTKVFSDNIADGINVAAGHRRVVITMLQQRLNELGITAKDLAKMGSSTNPNMFQGLLMALDWGGPTLHEIKINDRSYDMTDSNLLELYMIARQKGGLRHILNGGLIVNDVETGGLSEETLAKLTSRVEADPKLMGIIDIFTQIGEVWKESINQVSQRLEGKDIAIVDHWWGLDVPTPEELSGGKYKFHMNLIEDRSIFQERTHSKLPVRIGDAFQRFSMFENAISEYVGMAEPTRVARTVLNDRNFTELLRKKGYSRVRNNMLTILKRAQSAPPEKGSFDRLLYKSIPGIYRGVLTANPRIAMSQYTSSTNYQAFVSAKYLPLMASGMSPKAIERTLGMSDIAWDRFYMGHSSQELGELASNDAALVMFTGKTSYKNRLGIGLKIFDIAALSSGMEISIAEYTDAQNGTITGESAKYWADKDISFKDGAKMDWREAPQDWKRVVTKRAEYLWQRSQPSWDKWNRSVITSDPSAVKKLFFLFRSFHEKSLTILHGAHTEYVNSNKTLEDKALYAKKYGAVLSGYALNTVLRAAIMAGILWEVKEPYEYLKDLITAPFAMLPILGHVLDGSVRSFGNALTRHRSEYRGEAIESLPLTVINLMLRAPGAFATAAGYYINGDVEKANRALKRGVGELYMGVGLTMGVPVYELNRLYKGWIEEEEEKKKSYSLGGKKTSKKHYSLGGKK